MNRHGIDNANGGKHRPWTIQEVVILILAVAWILVSTALVARGADTASLIVKLQAGLSSAEQSAVITRNGGVEASAIPALRLHVVNVPVMDIGRIQADYLADRQVESVELNRTRQAEGASNDQSTGVQWALERIGWTSLFGTRTPSGSATVALLDTGVDASHPDLAANLIPGFSVMDGTTGLSDPNGHGTWMAGIVAAVTNNNEGIAGVAYSGVKVMPVTVLSANGAGQDSDIITGIVWAADHGADVILMAFSNPDFSQHLQDAIDYAWMKGAILVAATGNNGASTPTYPAGARGVIGVSATAEDDLLVPDSNVGQEVFLAAPGNNVFTTSLSGSYTYVTGTSASAAVVAGVASFMKADAPSLSNGAIVGRLARSADAVGTAGDPQNPVFFGNGRINMAKALAETGTDAVQPIGAPGGGGPYVGPYTAAAGGSGYKVSSVTVAAQAGPLTYGTSATASFAVTVRLAGNGTAASVTLDATPALQGVDYLWKTNADGSGPTIKWPLSLTSDTTNVFTLVVRTSASTPATTTQLTVTAADGSLPPKTGTGTLVIAKAPQSIGAVTVSPTTLNVGDSATVGATATSLLTVTFSSPTTNICSVTVKGQVTALATGNCSIAADQTGSNNYLPAPTQTQTITVGKMTQAPVTISAPSTVSYGQKNIKVSASGGSGTGAFSYSASSSTACSVDASSGSLSVTSGTGTCSVTATKAADGSYEAATSAAWTMTVNRAEATVVVTPVNKIYDGKEHGTTGTVTGVDSVTIGPASIGYNTTGGTAPVNAGSYLATGYFAGDLNYKAASGSATITIDKAIPVVTVDSVTAVYDGLAHGTTGTVAGVEGLFGTATVSYNTSSGNAPINAGSYTATGSFTGNDNYSAATGSATVTISKAIPTVTIIPIYTTYDGKEHGTTGSATGVNGAALSGEVKISYAPGSSAPVNAGSYSATGTFAESDNYLAANGSATITINKATPTVTIVPVTVTYDGKEHGTTGSATGVTGAQLGEVKISYSPGSSAPVNAGSYSATGTFAESDNYLAATGSATITINQATPTVTVIPVTVTYDAQPHSTTGSVTGVNGAPLGEASISYPAGTSAPVNAGSYSATGTFPGNDNYSAATGSATITINKATPTVTVIPVTVTYDGQSHSTMGTATGVDGAQLGEVSISYPASSPPVNAGSYNATGTFAGNDNYTAATGTAQITISKATPVVSVIAVAPATYDGAQHGTSGTVKGVSDFNLGAATMSYDTTDHAAPVNAGSYTATASFAENENYLPATATTVIVIQKATPTVSISPVARTTYDGTPHGTSGTVKGVGDFNLGAATMSYDTTDHTAPVNAGSYLATAGFPGNQNYNAASATTTILIDKAIPTVTVAAVAPATYDGTPRTTTAAVYGVANSLLGSAIMSYDTSDHNAPVHAGSYVATGSFEGNNNYLPAQGTTAITINKASTTVTVAASVNPAILGQPLTLSVTVAGAGGLLPPGTVTFYDNGAVLGSVTLGGSAMASLPLANLALGSHAITVVYGESANFLGGKGAFSETVNYGLAGLLPPYGPPAQKTYKVKSTIPIKWQFTDFSGTVVSSATAAPAVAIRGPYSCSESPDSVTAYIQLDDAGNSGYQYDSLTNTWQYNFKTSSIPTGCYSIQVSTGKPGAVGTLSSSQNRSAYKEYPIMLSK